MLFQLGTGMEGKSYNCWQHHSEDNPRNHPVSTHKKSPSGCDQQRRNCNPSLQIRQENERNEPHIDKISFM